MQFADLAGMVPGFGRYATVPVGARAGDPRAKVTRIGPGRATHRPRLDTSAAQVPCCGWIRGLLSACVALTDRPFDDWADEARRAWPELADAVIDEVAG